MKLFLKRFYKTGLLIYIKNYGPIIIINTAVINENSEQLYFMIFKNNLYNAKYVSSHVFHFTEPQEKY